MFGLQLLELALGVVKASMAGKASDVAGEVLALEQIAAAANHRYQELKGQPIDLSQLTYEPPVE